jgi:hypothetical protein
MVTRSASELALIFRMTWPRWAFTVTSLMPSSPASRPVRQQRLWQLERLRAQVDLLRPAQELAAPEVDGEVVEVDDHVTPARRGRTREVLQDFLILATDLLTSKKTSTRSDLPHVRHEPGQERRPVVPAPDEEDRARLHHREYDRSPVDRHHCLAT